MKNIVIIGTGQIGSRHLQALRAIDQKLNVYVIDPCVEALETAKQRYLSMPIGKIEHNISFYTNSNEISSDIEIAIIATTAKHRYSSAKSLVKEKAVKYLILEKPLCQSLKEIELFEELLYESEIITFVNCGRRMMEFWKNIRDEFTDSRINVEVVGSDWGFMCNLIHIIDLIAFITGCDRYELNCSNLDKELIQSKRDGNSELTGTVTLQFDDGSAALITSFRGGQLPRSITIYNKDKMAIVLEGSGTALFRNIKNDWQFEPMNCLIPYQSSLTTAVVKDLLEKGYCELTKFEESVILHRQMMEPITEFLNQYTNIKGDSFPFT